uniref:Potassium voltage-gated channel subfamily D member 1 n=1 Tax=Magallana gigas TaxID=29159 RepID=K1R824_MAGGI
MPVKGATVCIWLERNMTQSASRVKFNIRGRIFETFASTLKAVSDSKLGRLTPEHESYDGNNQEYFFDRDPDLFNVILNLLVTGNLHVPRQVCGALLREELSFWEIGNGNVSKCCWRQYFQHEDDIIVVFCIWNIEGLRTELYVSDFITHHYPDIHLSGNDKLTTLILTDPVPALFALETGCLVFFMVEWVLGLAVCPRKRDYLTSWTHVVSFVLVFAMLMNFLMEFFKSVLAENEVARWLYFIFKAISMVRLLLFIRVARRFSALRVLLLAIKNSLLELLLMAITFCLGMVFFATLIFYAEITNVESFSNIFISMWWAIITMTTVGYGDIHPSSVAGYIVGVFCALSGLLLLAMPVAIIASNFSEYYSQNNFYQRYLRLQKENRNKETCEMNKIHPHKEAKFDGLSWPAD